MKPIKIFLASSEELKYERQIIAELVTKLNYDLYEYGISIRLIKWEYLDSSMSTQHKQEDYNDQLRLCDACLVLFWNKFGPYTKIELDTAFDLLISGKGLKQMVVLFKESNKTTPELKRFREGYEIEHPELCRIFIDEANLKDIFKQQVLECIKSILSEEQTSLEKQIRRTQKLLTVKDVEKEEHQEYITELQALKDLFARSEKKFSLLKLSIQNI